MVNSVELLYRSKYSNKSQDEKLLLPMYFIARQQEKSLATKLIKSWNIWLQIPDPDLEKIEDILKILLSTNRIFNYLSDKPPKENDVTQTAVSLYGVAMTLNSSHYATCVAMEKLRDLHQKEAIILYTDENFNLHRAQEKDVNWQNKLIRPSEEEYLQMAESKTGYFLRLSVNLMKLFSKNSADFSGLISVLAKLFHIYDDYVNVLGLNQYFIDRTGFDDFKEGKFTFPNIHAMENHPKDTQIINLLRQRTDDDDMKKYYVKLLKQFGSLEYTKNTLIKLRNEAYEELKKFDKNSEMLEILENLVFDI